MLAGSEWGLTAVEGTAAGKTMSSLSLYVSIIYISPTVTPLVLLCLLGLVNKEKKLFYIEVRTLPGQLIPDALKIPPYKLPITFSNE